MHPKFESDFKNKVLFVSFENGSTLSSTSDVARLKEAWTKELSSWHSPYKALIDARNLEVGQESDTKPAMEKLFVFLSKFFLKKTVVFGGNGDASFWPVPWCPNEDEALVLLGVRGAKAPASGDFRSQIHLDNQFDQQVVELSLSQATIFAPEHVRTLRSKLTNNLSQWHSHWSLLIDCSKVRFSEEALPEFEKMRKFLSGFFLNNIVGYSPAERGLSYPFPCYLARHKAAAALKGPSTTSGRKANCQERKSS